MAMDTSSAATESTNKRTPEVLRTEIAQLEYQRWQAIFEGVSSVLIQEWNDVLNERRHELVQATLRTGQ
jgi:hypothetical protein